ncbi:MAG TPA: hypothetical protein ENF37_07860 [Beggiatoa sp.]|nr:hypothetical protein [Beggiatoa sp.]
MGPATKTRYRPPTLIYWWATKTRYPPYIDTIGGQQKHVTHPTLIYWWATKTRYPPYNSLNSKKSLAL